MSDMTGVNISTMNASEPANPDIAALMGMFAGFSAVGTLGNALALYVFSKMLKSKQHLTSTIFILTLAGTDFITSAVIIPYTMYMEYTGHHVEYDFVCKLYHVLSITAVDYSAFIMVAIAVDRYICICHPFSQAMTTFRAKIVIVSLACFAGGMGILTSLCYSVYAKRSTSYRLRNISDTFTITEFVDFQNSSFSDWPTGYDVDNSNSAVDGSYDFGIALNTSSREKYHWINRTKEEFYFDGLCDRRDYILPSSFQGVLQGFSSSLFLIVLVIVSFLYALIYRRVLQRKKAHPHIFSNYWCFCIPKPGLERSQGTINENGFETNNERRSLRSPSIRSPNARADKVFLANLKIAVTLFVVTVVFVAAYLPAWLMALKKIQENIIVFYTYFTHNVVNPLIYAFMNQKFREYLADIGKCPHR